LPPLLFLGAGASQPFSVPTMVRMVKKFEEHLKQNNIKGRNLYSQIKQTLEKGYDVSQVDIESVFSVITGIANQTSPQKMGHFPFYYIRRFSTERKFTQTEIDEAENLRNELEEFIRKECEFSGKEDELLEIYKNSYEPLFHNVEGVEWNKNDSGYEYSRNWKAYTTNYDTIFENYWSELHSIMDFFDLKGSEIAYFNAIKNVKGHLDTFVKIHGSIDWEKLENGGIIKSRTASFIRTKKKGKAMLYPIQQKDLYLYPWDVLFDEFKNGLNSCDPWYIIGYAFNDEFVLNSFLEFLPEGKRLIIINPHAKELKKKFPENLQKNVIALPIKFGDKYFAQDFEDFSTKQRALEIELQATSNHIGIDLPTTSKYIQNIKNENIQEEAIVTHHNNQTTFEFTSNDRPENKQQKTISFRAQMMFDIDRQNLEFATMNSDETSIRLTLKNQGRLIHTVTTSAPQYDGSKGMYISKVNIDAKKFFPH